MFDLLDRLSISLGRWFGVPVILHWSWVIMFALILVLSPSYSLVFAATFFMVLLHEFGHVLAAQHYKCRVNSVALYPIGGVAEMSMPTRPAHELVVALAGPAVNFALLPLWLVADLHPLLMKIAIVNTGLLCFNLLPAFPMDGGRVLRASLSWMGVSHLRSTLVAARVGQCFAALFVLAGVATLNVGFLFIGLFVFVAAQGELDAARSKSRFGPQSGGPVDESAQILWSAQELIARHNRR